MNDPLSRPVPRWLHVWAVLTAAVALLLLAIGQFVTSFGAGMADPIWPTEPWYVFGNASPEDAARFRADFKFFIEHTHRIAAWTFGGLVVVLAGGFWWTEPRPRARWAALAGLVVLVAGFGAFHGGLIAQKEVLAADLKVPVGALAVTLAGLGLTLGVGISGAVARRRGSGLRLVALAALVAAMVQGLLGGLRVRLNDLFGADLAAFHGVFAQVVFGLIVTLAVTTARRGAPAEAGSGARALHRSALLLAHLIFVQVVFGALVRHFPNHLNQRLHFLTAFLATALAALLIRAVLANPAARARAGWVARLCAALLVAQVYLGVEAWLARLGQYTLPELVPVTAAGGAVRSLHALVGSALWGAVLALTIRLRPVRAPSHTLKPVEFARPRDLPHAASAV